MSKISLIDFDAKTQSFHSAIPGFTRLRFAPCVELDGQSVDRFSWKAAGTNKKEILFHGHNRWGTWKLRFRFPDPAVSLLFEVVLEGKLLHRPTKARLTPIRFHEFSADHLLIHGRKMGGCESFLLEKGTASTPQSHFLIAVTKNHQTMQLSHPMRQKDLSEFSCRIADKKIHDLSAFTVFESGPGKNLKSAPVSLSASREGQDLMVNWAETQTGPQELQAVPQESGWNSWDYYRWTITEEEVFKNAELIASDPVLSRHIKRIIIDDGWQYCYGEWEPNCFFPSGMKKMAKVLTRMGFTPGLWFAPTIAEPHSRLAQLSPDVLTKGVSGFPCLGFSCMERKGFILDPTHPQVRAWWDELFRRHVSYGFRYFKLDFLAWTVPSRTFWDKKTRPGELMHRIIEPIRQAVGPSSRILGCNYNFEISDGLVDDVRISADIHACWPLLKANAASIAVRFWSHRRLWINDPDFTLCRGEETSDDPQLHQLKAMLPFVRPDDLNPTGIDYLNSLVDLNRREAEVLISLVITSGGAMNLSDNLPRLNAVGLDLLRKAVSAEKGNAAIPIDLFRTNLPSTWVQKLDSGLHRVLLVNWTEQKMRLSADLEQLNVPRQKTTNFWTGESVRLTGGRLSADLAPHSCLLVETTS